LSYPCLRPWSVQDQVTKLCFCTLTVRDALERLHVCGSTEVTEALEWELMCSETSALLARVMTELLATVHALSPPQQVRALDFYDLKYALGRYFE
jgi:hypothetical protein